MNSNKFLKFLREERVIIIICLIVFIINAAYAFYFKIQPSVDAKTYDAVAMNILEGKGFRLNLGVSASLDDVITYQGPLYQYFLAGVYKIFGHYHEAVWMSQSLLRTLSALMLFLICVKIFTPAPLKKFVLKDSLDLYSSVSNKKEKLAGWFAAAFFGLYPDLIEINAMLMTETLSIFSMILVVYIFIRYFDQINFRGTFLLGFAAGMTILVRSTVGIFLPVLIFYFLRRGTYKHLCLFLTLVVLIMTPWTIRNYFVYQSFIPTMANFGYNLWVGNHEGGDGEGAVMPEYGPVIQQYGIIGTNYYAINQFKNFVSDYPFTYIKLVASRALKYFSFVRPMGFWFYQSGISQLIFIVSSVLSSVVLFSFGFAGIFLALKKERENSQLIYLITFAFLTCLSVILILIESRYRLPIYPFMAIFAGFFITRFVAARKVYFRYLLTAFIVLFFFSMINVALEFNKIMDKLGQILYKS